MDCKEAEKMIPEYLSGELSGKQALNFIDHVEHCPECMEELSIQFLVKEGTARLEDGSSFDLNVELKNKIERSKTDIRRQRKVNLFIYFMEALAIVAVIFILILVIWHR